jgi:hypothetical protein
VGAAAAAAEETSTSILSLLSAIVVAQQQVLQKSPAHQQNRVRGRGSTTKRNKTLCTLDLDRNRIPQTVTLISTAAISS